MSKNRKKIDTGQIDIFEVIETLSRKQSEVLDTQPTQGKASIDVAIRSIITAALKRSPLSRFEVAAKMSEILGVEITKAQLDAWSAESKENHRFPLVYIGAFCQATGDYALPRYMAQLCGGYFIESHDALLLELGRIEKTRTELTEKENLIRGLLGGKK